MITLIGHGYVGEHIAEELTTQKLEYTWISHTDAVPENTSVIINAAGYTGSPNVDACEIYKQETIDGNVTFPVKLERENAQIPIVHISSGCIYTGYEKEYTEDDEPNFTFNNGSFYSGSKALGQEMLKPYLHKSYLLRIRMPFGNKHHPKNFLTKMVKYEKLISYDNSLSYLPDVAAVAVAMAVHRTIAPGIYNLTNPGSSNAREIVAMMGMEKEFFTPEEFSKATVAPRSNCVLSTNKLDAVYKLRPVREALELAISKL